MNIEYAQLTFDFKPVEHTKDLGLIMEANFKWAKQCKKAAHKARRELFRLRSVLTCRKPEVFVPLYKAFVRPHLEYRI